MVSRRAAIILAAGASQRMGTPKALLPWNGSTLVEYAVQQARDAQAEAVVVLGPATQHLSLDTVTVVNPEPETGRSASIRLGANALRDDVERVLVQSVDQPVPAWVLLALFAANAEVAVPTFGGRRGHPVCLAGNLLSELREVTEADQGLRAVVRRHAVTEVPVETEAVLWNLNDPDTYAAIAAGSVIWFRAVLVALVAGVAVVALTQAAARPAPQAVPQAVPTAVATPTDVPTRVALPTLAPQAVVSRISRETPQPIVAPNRSTLPQVDVVDYGFSPAQLTIHVGTTVTFTNGGGDGHDVTGTGPGGEWRSGPLAPTERYSREFALPGTYNYVCTIHPEMRGSIAVQP